MYDNIEISYSSYMPRDLASPVTPIDTIILDRYFFLYNKA